MNNFKQSIMHTTDDLSREERSRRTERRLLVIVLCLSYIGCLATLWYIWNAPRQAFDAFWLSFGQTRFSLIILPLLLLGSSYFSLLRITGDIMGWGVKKLDERQRMVRDQAHRYAYKIIALLCLFTPIYLIIQNMLTAAPLAANILGNAIMRSQTTTAIRMVISQPHSSPAVQTIYIARNALLNQGIYYALFLLTVALIVWTLPRVIIAWKERG
jgi:hypothetical protein